MMYLGYLNMRSVDCVKIKYRAAVTEKEFTFQVGDDIKIIATSFLYATENRPERIYEAKLVEVEEHGFWATLKSVTVHPFSEQQREGGISEQLDPQEEFFAFVEIEDVLSINDHYPDRKDPLIRFALDGPRGSQRTGHRNPGRPSLGVTRKVSLTLPEETWEWFDAEAEKLVGSRSALLRYLINREQSPESRWSNNACLGYAILGAQKLGYSEEQLKQLVRGIYSQFDWKSVDEAKEIYNKSPY